MTDGQSTAFRRGGTVTSAMGPPLPRTKPAELRRAELLDAAEALVAAGEPLTVHAITMRAGVAKGTFYVYFATKDDVLAALRDRLAADILAGHERALAEIDPDDHAARLDRWIADAIHGRVERAELRDAIFHRHRPGHRGMAGAASHVAMLAALLQTGVDAGAMAIDDVETTAALLYGAMHSGVDALLADAEPRDVERLVAAMQTLARRAAGLVA
jgi:AcrR family transcriptional regulator